MSVAVPSVIRRRPSSRARRAPWRRAATLLVAVALCVVGFARPQHPATGTQPSPPPTFAGLMGYRPVTLVTADGGARWAKPTGACSSLWGGQPFGFTPVCRSHDYGYDVLRHEAATGTPLPASARREIDALFAQDLHARCTATQRGARAQACHVLARVSVAAVRFNSWRQLDGPPVQEPVAAWLLGSATLLIALTAGARTARRRLGGWAAAVAAATPPDRDRYVDLLRTTSVLVVVLGHWLMLVVTRGPDGIVGDNLLAAVPALQPATWLLQVLPVFFFVGGFANLTTWQRALARGEGPAGYLLGRVRRLAVPATVFAVAWTTAAPLLRGAGVDGALVDVVVRLVAQPLWFLAAYLGVSALVPITAGLHARHGSRAVIALAAAAMVVDLASVALGAPLLRGINHALVWLCIHQCGYSYAGARAWPVHRYAALAVLGLLALIALTGVGPYPVSMVGLPGAAVSNMNPPTVAILALAAFQIGVAMLLRPRLSAWLARPRVWSLVALAGSASMTLFLWHLTAAIAVLGLALAAGVLLPAPDTAQWWMQRPAWLLADMVVLAPVVWCLSPLERRRRRGRSGTVGARLPVALTATAAGVTGCAWLALTGFRPATALTGAGLLAAAVVLTVVPAHPHARRRVDGIRRRPRRDARPTLRACPPVVTTPAPRVPPPH